MEIKKGYEDWCYSVFNDGFWYSLNDGENVSTPEGLHLVDEGDAERVLEALNVLREYEEACDFASNLYMEREDDDEE